MNSSIQQFVGCDVSDTTSKVCLLDPQGEILEETTIRTTPEAAERFYGRLQRSRVVIEAGTHSPWMAPLIESLGHEVLVANPNQLGIIWKSKKKTDREDARTLAECGRVNAKFLCPIRHRGAGAAETLAVVRTRSVLVQARTLLVNHVRGVVKTTGERMPKCAAEKFHELTEVLPPARRELLEPVMELVGNLTEKIGAADKTIEKKFDDIPEAKQFVEIQGVGRLTAVAFVALVEDPHRFTRNRDIGPYLGMTPRIDESGTIKKKLGITKEGDRYLRCLLVNCAQHILRSNGKDSDLRKWGLALADTKGKKKAVIAVARKLAVLMLALWKSGKAYEPLRVASKHKSEGDGLATAGSTALQTTEVGRKRKKPATPAKKTEKGRRRARAESTAAAA